MQTQVSSKTTNFFQIQNQPFYLKLELYELLNEQTALNFSSLSEGFNKILICRYREIFKKRC
jgi:uncharacterized membrane protein (DUF2068 family)